MSVRSTVLVLLVVLAACGGGGGGTTDGPAPADGPGRADAGGADAAGDAMPPDATVPDAGPFVVNGLVLDTDHLPLAGQLVHASGGASATTDANGMFTLTGLTPPYDLILWDPDAVDGPFSAPTAVLYLGLTRSDPAIVHFMAHPQANSGTAVMTVMAPGGISYSTDHGLELLESPLERIGASSPSADGFLYASTWAGPPGPLIVPIHVYTHVESPDGFITQLTRYGSTAVTLGGGGSTLFDITLGGAPPTITLSGTVSYPAADLSRTWQVMQIGGGTWQLAQGGVLPAGPFSVLAPSHPSATYAVCATAIDTTGYSPPTSMACRGALPPATAANIDVVAPPWGDPVMPGDNATAPIEGPFAWTTPVGGASLLHISSGIVGRASVYVVLDGTTVTLPDLAAFGVPAAPSGASYSWVVLTYPEVASVDAAADPVAPLARVWYDGPYLLRSRIDATSSLTKTRLRTFTTP